MKNRNIRSIKGRQSLTAYQNKDSQKTLTGYRFRNHLRNTADKSVAAAKKSIPIFALIAVTGVATFAGNSYLPSSNLSAVAQNVHSIEYVAASQNLTSGKTPSTIITRDAYSVENPPPQISYSSVQDAGSFENSSEAAVQYPFGVGVHISSPYGERVPVCTEAYGCGSSFHTGVDFDPGAGTPIQAIADGVVIEVSHGGTAYGNYVKIEHYVDGDRVVSMYAHIQDGGPLSVGDIIKVGDLVGNVGSTGRSTGPHLHFELTVNGERIDPMSWEKWNTGEKW